jgi:STE24 endopeptidase
VSKWWRNSLLAAACGAAVWGLRMTFAAPAPGSPAPDRVPGDLPGAVPAGPREERAPAGAARSRGDAGPLAPRVTPAMRRYSYTRYALAFIGPLYELAALALVLETRLSARLRDLAERRFRHPFMRAAAYTLLFGAVYTALLFPLTFTSGWYLEQRFRLSRQSLPAWLWDGLKGLLVNAVIAPPMLWLLYTCIRRSRRRWWLGFWLASLPLLTLLVLVAPVVIDPLFHRFEPLRDTALREKILALAARAGIEGGRVYQVDMSEKTRALNAYVNGLGETKRIVLWDTLLARLKEDEILFVMGHEMAHYVYHHILILLGLGFGGLFVFFGLTDRAARFLLARRGERWGVTELSDMASLPVILAVLSALQFLGTPATAAVSRAMERQADSFGLRLTGNGEAAARAFVKLSEDNLSLPSPPPLVEFWLFTHPPLQERIDRALAFDRRH